jgi:hypothetical protein
MLTFYIYFGIICVCMFALICFASYIVEKEKRDPVFAEKMDRFREKWSRLDPFTRFVKNLFWWAATAAFIWFIYLG